MPLADIITGIIEQTYEPGQVIISTEGIKFEILSANLIRISADGIVQLMESISSSIHFLQESE